MKNLNPPNSPQPKTLDKGKDVNVIGMKELERKTVQRPLQPLRPAKSLPEKKNVINLGLRLKPSFKDVLAMPEDAFIDYDLCKILITGFMHYLKPNYYIDRAKIPTCDGRYGTLYLKGGIMEQIMANLSEKGKKEFLNERKGKNEC